MGWRSRAGALGALALATCSACSGSDGSGSVSGTVLGMPVPTNAVLASQSTVGAGAAFTQTVTVTFASVSQECSDQEQGTVAANLTTLGMSVTAVGAPLTPGTYAVGMSTSGQSTLEVSASYITSDAMCHAAADDAATSGSVTLTAIGSSRVQGSFDLTLTGDHVTGSFDAAVCNLNTNVGGPTCIQ